MMKLFLISQAQNNTHDYYDSAVVAAADAAAAALIDPDTGKPINWDSAWHWCSGPMYVTVRYIGDAAANVKAGVVCASYHAS